MLILDQEFQAVGRISTFIAARVERERMATIVRLFGKLVAYLPHNGRSYYAWALILSYRPAQHLSVYQFSPAHLRVMLFSKYEFGLVLGNWLLGLRLGQPLVWVKRLQAT